MDNLEYILEKYENDILEKIDYNNMRKIILFLQDEGIFYIDEIVDEYLDLFVIEYDEFVERFMRLKNKYNDDIVTLIEENLGILEEF